jgi:hypothetical protein
MVVQTAFRHVRASRALEAVIRVKAEQLEPLGTILKCHVVVDRPHRHHRRGNAIQARIELSRPGEDIIVNVDGHPTAGTAIDEAFNIARRRLEDVRSGLRAATRHVPVTL